MVSPPALYDVPLVGGDARSLKAEMVAAVMAKPEVAPIRLWPAHVRLVGEAADIVGSRYWVRDEQFVPALGCATLSDT